MQKRWTPRSSKLFVNPSHFVIFLLISLCSFDSPPSSRVTSALSLRPLPSFCTVFPALIPSLSLYSLSPSSTSLILHRVPHPHPVIVARFLFVRHRPICFLHESQNHPPALCRPIGRTFCGHLPTHAHFDRPAFPRHDRAAVPDPCPHCGGSFQQNRDGIEM
jgi:hypothetical protein